MFLMMEKEINGHIVCTGMGIWNQEQFNDIVIDKRRIGFSEKDIELKSGRLSRFYVNWRPQTDTVAAADLLGEWVADFLLHNGITTTCVYGVPEGATKAGHAATRYLAHQSGNPGAYTLAQGRSKPKPHGKPEDRFFVGAPKGDTVVLEDVTTTGKSLLDAIDTVVQIPDARIVAVIGLTNRMELRDDGRSVVEAVAAKGFRYLAMSEAPKLLKLEYAVRKPTDETARLVEEEFEKYGVAPLRLRE